MKHRVHEARIAMIGGVDMRTFPLPRVAFLVCRVLVRLVALTLPLRVKKRKRIELRILEESTLL